MILQLSLKISIVTNHVVATLHAKGLYITGPHQKSYHCLSDTSNGTAMCISIAITASVLTSLDT